MKTSQQIILKSLLTLKEYYKYRVEDKDYSSALHSLYKKNLVDDNYKIVREYIEDNKFSLIQSIPLWFIKDVLKQRLYYLSYLIKRLKKQYKIKNTPIVFLYIPSMQGYVYFNKHNAIDIGDINQKNNMSLLVAKEAQRNIELKSIIIYDSI